MNIISTEKAPGAIGPYSQGYTVGGLVFTSGQIPVDPATGAVAEGIAAQADQSCRNVGAILEAAGVGFDKVVKTTCFLADIADFAAFNEVYAKYFTSKPARSCVAVKDRPRACSARSKPSLRPKPPFQHKEGPSALHSGCGRPLLSVFDSSFSCWPAFLAGEIDFVFRFCYNRIKLL